MYHKAKPSADPSGDQPLKPSSGKKVLRVILVLLVIGVILAVVAYSMLPKLNTIAISKVPEEIGIISPEDSNLPEEEKEVYQEKQEAVMNILLIGVDGEGYDKVRSDVMMIMTINRNTQKIHLTSVQRDTMAFIPLKGTYEKINNAFAYDGALGTLKALNQNYDLNLENFVAFDFKALIKMIDAIGGVVVDVDQAEFNALRAAGLAPEGTGMQKLNAEQALYFARTRKGTGDDPGRNERQREILKYVFSAAKNMSMTQLKNLAEDFLPEIQTSYSYTDMLSMLDYYQVIKGSSEFVDHSFPFDKKGAMLDERSYVIPFTVASNITKLHEIIYEYANYVPSDRAMEYHAYIGKKSGFFK